MAKNSHKIKLQKPENFFKKPIKIEFKQLVKAISKDITHLATGKWEEMANDTVETFSALGIVTKPEELAFILIKRALTKAVYRLISESIATQLAEIKQTADVPEIVNSLRQIPI